MNVGFFVVVVVVVKRVLRKRNAIFFPRSRRGKPICIIVCVLYFCLSKTKSNSSQTSNRKGSLFPLPFAPLILSSCGKLFSP